MSVEVNTGKIIGLEKAVYQPLFRIFKQMKTSLDGFVANFSNGDKVTKKDKPVVTFHSITNLFNRAEGSYYL
ncbi:MAG: hypothetical protein WCG95_09685 [bacterium]